MSDSYINVFDPSRLLVEVHSVGRYLAIRGTLTLNPIFPPLGNAECREWRAATDPDATEGIVSSHCSGSDTQTESLNGSTITATMFGQYSLLESNSSEWGSFIAFDTGQYVTLPSPEAEVETYAAFEQPTQNVAYEVEPLPAETIDLPPRSALPEASWSAATVFNTRVFPRAWDGAVFCQLIGQVVGGVPGYLGRTARCLGEGSGPERMVFTFDFSGVDPGELEGSRWRCIGHSQRAGETDLYFLFEPVPEEESGGEEE